MPEPTHKQTTTPDPLTEDQLIEEVALWLVKMSSDDCNENDRQAFIDWQQQDPHRIELVQQMQSTLQHFTQLQQSDSPKAISHTIQQVITDKKSAYWLQRSVVIFLASGILATWMAWQFLPMNSWLADTRTPYDNWSEQTLADHSGIKISGKTAYDIHFNQAQRRIELFNGNILVDVAKDTTRPFIIETKYARITALGTRFIVQHYGETTVLTMLESRTKVDSLTSSGQSIGVSAGQQVIIDKNGIQNQLSISPELLEIAWQKHMLVIDKMPLDQVLGLLQSYHQQTFVYEPSELNHIVVNATLPLNDSGLALLERSLPIQVKPILFGRVKITTSSEK